MSKVLIDRSAVEQALDAFDVCKTEPTGYTPHRRLRNAAITALRAALEQPQDHFPYAGNRVPTGWKLVPVEPTNEMVQAWLDTYEGNIQTVYRAFLTAAPQSPVVDQPQVEQEPVAEITGMDEYGPMLGWHKHWAEFPVGTKLHTHPQPPRQPLTREAIDAIIKSNFVSINDQNLYDAIYLCLRDVESAHDIEEQT